MSDGPDPGRLRQALAECHFGSPRENRSHASEFETPFKENLHFMVTLEVKTCMSLPFLGAGCAVVTEVAIVTRGTRVTIVTIVGTVAIVTMETIGPLDLVSCQLSVVSGR